MLRMPARETFYNDLHLTTGIQVSRAHHLLTSVITCRLGGGCRCTHAGNATIWGQTMINLSETPAHAASAASCNSCYIQKGCPIRWGPPPAINKWEARHIHDDVCARRSSPRPGLFATVGVGPHFPEFPRIEPHRLTVLGTSIPT